MDEYPNLQFYWQTGSNLTEVPENFFASTPNMKYVNFYGNKIERIGEGLLDNLNNLKRAGFEANICIDDEASTPYELPELKQELKRNCTGITSQPLKCSINRIEDFVCELDVKIEKLKKNNEKFQALENLKIEIKNLKDHVKILEDQIKDLIEKNENLKRSVEKMKALKNLIELLNDRLAKKKALV